MLSDRAGWLPSVYRIALLPGVMSGSRCAVLAITSLSLVRFMSPRKSTGAGGRAPAQPTRPQVKGPGHSPGNSDSSVTNQETRLPLERLKL